MRRACLRCKFDSTSVQSSMERICATVLMKRAVVRVGSESYLHEENTRNHICTIVRTGRVCLGVSEQERPRRDVEHASPLEEGLSRDLRARKTSTRCTFSSKSIRERSPDRDIVILCSSTKSVPLLWQTLLPISTGGGPWGNQSHISSLCTRYDLMWKLVQLQVEMLHWQEVHKFDEYAFLRKGVVELSYKILDTTRSQTNLFPLPSSPRAHKYTFKSQQVVASSGHIPFLTMSTSRHTEIKTFWDFDMQTASV